MTKTDTPNIRQITGLEEQPASYFQYTNQQKIALAVLFTSSVVLTILIWLKYRSQKPNKSRPVSSTESSRKASWVQISSFYNKANHPARAAFKQPPTCLASLKRNPLVNPNRHSKSNSMMMTMVNACVSRPARLHSLTNSCSSLSAAPKVHFFVSSPPVGIGVPQPIQPAGPVQSELVSSSTSRIQTETDKQSITTSDLLQSSAAKVGPPVGTTHKSKADPSSNNSPKDVKTYNVTGPVLMRHNAVDIDESLPMRPKSVHPTARFSLQEDYASRSTGARAHRISGADGAKALFSRHSMGETEGVWTQLDSSVCVKSRISFSVLYVCTTELLKVTINRLNGVHLITSSGNLLPSQTETAFVVSVRLSLRNSPDSNMDETRPNGLQFTHSVAATLNPVFDQSFTFKLSLKEIEGCGLLFTVYRITLKPRSSEDFVQQRRASQTCLTGQTIQRQRFQDRIRKGETVCLGSAYYSLRRADLLNRPETLQEIWRDIHRHLGLDEEDDINLKPNPVKRTSSVTTWDHVRVPRGKPVWVSWDVMFKTDPQIFSDARNNAPVTAKGKLQ